MDAKEPESKKIEDIIPKWFVDLKQMLKKNEDHSP